MTRVKHANPTVGASVLKQNCDTRSESLLIERSVPQPAVKNNGIAVSDVYFHNASLRIDRSGPLKNGGLRSLSSLEASLVLMLLNRRPVVM